VEDIGEIGIDSVDSVDGVSVKGGDDDARISVFFPFFFALAVYLRWYSLSNYICVL
jgi:hypothetical protein